jgi:hypothetical protein
MWHWHDDRRSADYRPTVISENLMRPGTFVFMGVKRPASGFDPHWVLAAFDRLLPVYRYVMARDAATPTLEPPRPFLFTPQRAAGDAQSTRASTRARMFDVNLRHRVLQTTLCDELAATLGPDKISEEAAIGGFRADIVTREDSGYVLYEIKTGGTVPACLREALGQLLEYGFWPEAMAPVRLVVSGEPEIDDDARVYIARLNTAAFPAKIEYKTIKLPRQGQRCATTILCIARLSQEETPNQDCKRPYIA